MRKTYLGWTVFASVETVVFIFKIIEWIFDGTFSFKNFLLGIAVCSFLWFMSYRRFTEYGEWRTEYESNLKKNEAIIKAAEKYVDGEQK